jgi:hypothetical protein
MATMLIKKLMAMLAVLLLPALAFAQLAAGGRAKTAEPAAKPAESVPAAAGARYENLGRRDPFLNPLLLRKESEQRNKVEDEEISRGSAPPGIAGMFVAQVSLLGVSTSTEKRTAVFRGTDKRAYFLQEGDRLFDGYVKKIGTDDVLMIREMQFRSGKVTTQEVTKRLRTP